MRPFYIQNVFSDPEDQATGGIFCSSSHKSQLATKLTSAPAGGVQKHVFIIPCKRDFQPSPLDMTSFVQETCVEKRIPLTELVVTLPQSRFPPPVLKLLQSRRLSRKVQRLKQKKATTFLVGTYFKYARRETS